MDTASLLMGASIASIAWIAIYPWSKLARLRKLEASAGSPADPETPQ